MFSSPFVSYNHPFSYGGYPSYQQQYRRQPYYQYSPYSNTYDDFGFNPYFSQTPSYASNYDPYEEELRRRQNKKMVDEREEMQFQDPSPIKHNQNVKSQQNKNKFSNSNTKTKKNKLQKSEMDCEDSSSEGGSFEKIKSQNMDSSFEQITKESIKNKNAQKPNNNQNNEQLQQNFPQFIRIDSKTCMQEEKINYWQEVNNMPNKNNLKDGLIEEKYPDEIEQKAEKLSQITQKDYSYCLQIVLQNPNNSLGQFIDIILNKQQKREQQK